MPGMTALQVKNAKPGRHADGCGLYLMVRESGSRSWVLRAQFEGKRQDIGLGSAKKLTLAQARIKAVELRMRIEAGEPLRPEAPAPKPELLVPTFKAAAEKCHAEIKNGWKNQHHSDSWLSSLELHIFPALGERPVDQVNSLLVRDALAPIWLKIPESARRILQRIGTVLDFAHIQGWCPHEAALRSVRKGLPRQPTEDNHFAAMPHDQVPAFVAHLSGLVESAGRDALLFTILSAVRSGETRYATWPEFDLDAGLWTIPASRMKMKKIHIVPLAPASIAILKRRWPLRLNDEGFVFSTHGKRPLSDMTMSKLLRENWGERFTVHGFRSSFTDWAAEKTKTPKEVVDKALAHKLPDRVEAAYRRTDFLERRRKLMRAWAMHATRTLGS